MPTSLPRPAGVKWVGSQQEVISLVANVVKVGNRRGGWDLVLETPSWFCRDWNPSFLEKKSTFHGSIHGRFLVCSLLQVPWPRICQVWMETPRHCWNRWGKHRQFRSQKCSGLKMMLDQIPSGFLLRWIPCPCEQWKKTWLFSVYRGLYYPVI